MNRPATPARLPAVHLRHDGGSLLDDTAPIATSAGVTLQMPLNSNVAPRANRPVGTGGTGAEAPRPRIDVIAPAAPEGDVTMQVGRAMAVGGALVATAGTALVVAGQFVHGESLRLGMSVPGSVAMVGGAGVAIAGASFYLSGRSAAQAMELDDLAAQA